MIHRFTVRFSGPLLLGCGLFALANCRAPDPTRPPPLPPQQAMKRPIDLKRFMGKWYVIAHIPTAIEKNAWSAVESYQLDDDGTITTTFTFNKGGFDGPEKTYHPRGFVFNQDTRTEWRMRFIWPFKAAYLITYLDDAYTTTVVGVPDRSYAWIMARTPSIPEAKYRELVELLRTSGHDVTQLRKVPQRD